MEISEACYGILTCENVALKLSKTAKRTNNTCITCTIALWLAELFYFSKAVSGRPLT